MIPTITARPIDAGEVELRFKFDTWLNAACKALPGARLVSGGWNIPRESFPALCASVGASALKIEDPTGELVQIVPPDPFAEGRPREVLSDFRPLCPTWGELNTDRGLTSDDYQAVGSSFLINHEKALLLDDVGLGKTKQLIDAVSYVYQRDRRPTNILVVAKPISLSNWRNEIGMFSVPCETRMLRGSVSQRRNQLLMRSIEHLLCYFVVSWQTMRIDVDALAKIDWDWIVLDEAHLAKSTPMNGDQSKQAAAIYSLQAPRKVAMTGTYLINAPPDAWNVLHWMGIDHRNWDEFERATLKTIRYSPDRYKTFKLKMVVGYQPTGMIKLRELIGSSMIRRLKDEEMPALPPFIRTDVEVILDDEETKRYRAVEKELLLYLNDLEHVEEVDVMTKALRLKQTISTIETFVGKACASSKIVTVESLVDDLVDGGQKVLIGTVFVATVNALERQLAKYNPAVVHGGIPSAQRDREIERFQSDPDCRVFIASVAACREAINLTAASAIIHVDKEWAQAYVDQFEGRARRIGSEKHNGINVYSLMARLPNGEKTIDYGIATLLDKKQKMVSQLVGKA